MVAGDYAKRTQGAPIEHSISRERLLLGMKRGMGI